MKQRITDVYLLAIFGCLTTFGQETLPVITDGDVPQTFEELWAD